MTARITRGRAVMLCPDACRYAPQTMAQLEDTLGHGAAAAVVDCLWQGTVRAADNPNHGYVACSPPPSGERRRGMLRGAAEVHAAYLERGRQRESVKRFGTKATRAT